MRVKISYGVDLENIPTEVSELFDFVWQRNKRVEHQIDTINSIIEEDTEGALALMKKMRSTLGEMDSRLSDLCLILEGYDQFKKQQEVNNEIQQGRPTMDTTSSDDVRTGQPAQGLGNSSEVQ